MVVPMTSTPLQQLLEMALEPAGGAQEYIDERRANGNTWDEIARSVHRDTGHRVSRESLRGWYGP